MFGTSGIRGPVGEQVTAETALDVGRALASRGATTVVVGRDHRPSGRVLADAVSAGIRECGADVLRLGPVTTPTLARSVGWTDADAGVAVTGSHNPSTDNGIKLWTPSGRAFDGSQRREITRRISNEAFALAAWDGHGTEHRWRGATGHHRERLVAAHDDLSLSVVVDVGNGTGRVTADALDELGCTVRTLNAQPDGSFPGRPSEPTADNCDDLARAVEATDADLGVAHDGDADRMMAVTEAGEFVDGDRLLALFASEQVSPGKRVAVPVDTSLLVTDAVEAAGGSVVHTRVGDVFVAERADEADVVFGGEPSGAWIWPDETLCPDGPYAACRLAALVERRGPLSELVNRIERYPIRRESVPVADKHDVMNRVQERVARAFDDVDRTDGVRVSLDGGWFLVRASGTEPLVRVTCEARSAKRADAILDRTLSLVSSAADVDPSQSREREE